MSAGFYGRKARVKNYERTEVSGIWFSSKLEASIYQILKLEEKAGVLKVLACQNRVKLSDAEIVYIPDFKILNCESGAEEWVEAKGFETDIWLLKKKLWKFYGPGPLHIWKGSHARPKFTETIFPKCGLIQD